MNERNPYEPPRAKVQTQAEFQQNRRPAMLWVIVVVFSFIAIVAVATYIYLGFFSEIDAVRQSGYVETTFSGHIARFYPVLLIVAGVVGFLMLKRWTLYVFGMLSVVRLYYVAKIALGEPLQSEMAWVVWTPRLLSMSFSIFATLYAFRLVRKGLLR